MVDAAGHQPHTQVVNHRAAIATHPKPSLPCLPLLHAYAMPPSSHSDAGGCRILQRSLQRASVSALESAARPCLKLICPMFVAGSCAKAAGRAAQPSRPHRSRSRKELLGIPITCSWAARSCQVSFALCVAACCRVSCFDWAAASCRAAAAVAKWLRQMSRQTCWMYSR